MKTVMLWGAAHNALLKLKDNETSFSEVILKLANKYNKKNEFKKFPGSLEGKSDDYEIIKKDHENERPRNDQKL